MKDTEVEVNGERTWDLSKFGFILRASQIVGIVIGTVYFVVFVYQMRDAIRENILAQNGHQERVLAKQEEQIRVEKQIACLLKFHIYQEKTQYKGQCENGFSYYQP